MALILETPGFFLAIDFHNDPGAAVRAFMVHVFAVFVETRRGDGVSPSLTGKFMQVFAPSLITGNIQVTVACGFAAFRINNLNHT